MNDLLLRRHQQHFHLPRSGFLIQYLEVDADFVHPEGYVLLGFPVDGLPGLCLGHFLHGNSSDYNASSGNGRTDRSGLYTSLCQGILMDSTR